ncbi:MAG: methyl-accepting chemotaxis protein [Spirochaetales bacterium]|nr:methyl-accepting chemotaxis protein [Spirochaetales bacterium]
MTFNLRISLKAKLLIIIILVVTISSFLISFNAIKKSKPAIESVANEYLSQVTKSVADGVISINSQEFKLIYALSKMELLRSDKYTLQEKQAQLASILSGLGDRYQNLAFYDKNGNAIRDTGELINLANRDYFKKAISGHEVLTDPTYSPISNSFLTYYGIPVNGYDNKPIGALILIVKGNSIQNLIESIDVGGGNHPSIFNRSTKNVIARSEEETAIEEEAGPDLERIMENLMGGKTGTDIFFSTTLNKKMICSFEPIPYSDWSVFVAAPYENYMGAISDIRISTVIWLAIAIVFAVIISTIALNITTKPLIFLKDSISEIATGNADLAKRIPETSNDEIGDVVNGFNQFVEKLQHIVQNLKVSKNSLTVIDSDLQAGTQDTSASISQIISSIENVNDQIQNQAGSVVETASAVNEISSNIESLEKMIEHQSQEVSIASSAVEEMIGNINSVNNGVSKMVSSFEQLEAKTNAGINSLAVTNEKINQINDESRMLQDANTAIASIANQTNLLAMNAAIEAAHAGEAGKGFAVVADEIRKLSETSSAQSKTVSAELNKIQETIKNVVETTTVTNKAFSSVSENIIETSKIIHEIKGAMEEQQTGSKQIVDALHVMNNSTVEVKSASSEMTVGNQQILELVQKLQSVTDNIRQSMDEMQHGAEKINETGSALTTITDKVEHSVNEIGKEIDLFKV